MKHISTFTKFYGVGVLAVFVATGCADRNKNDIPDSPATTPEISKTVDNMTDTAGKAVKKAVPALEKSADEAADLARQAANTATVKAAILDNAAMKGSTIDVDTKGKTVWLNGTVKNAAQKKVAGDIAKKKASGYNIKNQLKVTGGASPKMKQ